MYHNSPPFIFFFSFAKKDLKPATSVVMSDFPIHEEETNLQNILPPLRESIVVAVHINWTGLPCDKVSKLHDLNVRAKAENACVGEVITVLDDVLSCFNVSKPVNLPELAVNKFVVNE